MNLLVVEDNDIDMEKIERALGTLDYDTRLTRARDGLEALDFLGGPSEVSAADSNFAILLDINLPRLNGIEFLDRLRKHPAHRYTPVVVLSTSDLKPDVAAAAAYRVASYIVKPLSAATLLEALETVAERLRQPILVQDPQDT